MKGVVFENPGAEPKVVDNLQKPSPGSDQMLVKSLWTAINPVDSLMANSGLMVRSWPFVVSVDASGVVVEAGSEAQSKYGFKVGDYVCGCTRLGTEGYSAGQEYFLMDAAVTIPKPKNVDLRQAATIGVGIETAGMGIFAGLNIDLPDPANLPQEKNEWVVVLGGASSVGKFAIQLARAAGYKVIASCSSRSATVVESLGAATFDYKDTTEKQVADILAVTGEGVNRVFDVMASENPEIAIELFKQSTASKKYFTTTNDWNSPDEFEGSKTYKISLGPIGQPDATELNVMLGKYIPVFVGLIESGVVTPSDYHAVGEGDFEDVIQAYKFQQTGQAGSKKVIVKVQDQ